MSELVALHENAGTASVGFCRISRCRSDRSQSLVIIENNQKILLVVQHDYRSVEEAILIGK